ncbi:MAG: DNA mismatch repair endonuclease MutL [Eubacteriales bacterium]|nr:DNA mismatch repair endonuclease MutL [Eubacteriales bacterium]
MIRVLEKSVCDKISAGEVIDRPVSVVKELVENSVDAGADEIMVEIREGGKTYMRVTDNGCGIPHSECETAFLRHATSKISKAEDLENISSLGFRGEALASIAAVTRLSMITKGKGEDTGTRIVIHGGDVVENSSVGCPDGTTMVVTDLFYNTPARREFLKANGTEAGKIIDFLQEYAIAYPSIRFRLINGGKNVFVTSGRGHRKEAILSVYQQNEYRDLLEIDAEMPGYHLEGCISRPSLSRPNRRDQVFFVNGRVVKSRIMEQGVDRGYKERLFPSRHPVVFLFLTVNPKTVDVNIHPSKKEVRFHEDRAVEIFLETAIEKRLASEEAVIDASDYFREEENREDRKRREGIQEDINSFLETKRASRPSFSGHFPSGSGYAYYGSVMSPNRNHQISEPRAQEFVSDSHNKWNTSAGASYKGSSPSGQDEAAEVLETYIRQGKNEDPAESFDLEPPRLRPFDFSALSIVGSIFDTYILCTDEKAFYMFDQHAAHERVFYEKLVGTYLSEKKLSQMILTPLLIDVPLSLSDSLDPFLQDLRDMGYDISLFGPGTVRITAIPTFMELSEAEQFVRDFLDGAADGAHSPNRVVIDKLITRSCKSAVKAHDKLRVSEMKALMDQLAQCRNPFSCTHGRPTFIRFTLYEIEKFFKRIQ